MTTDKTPATLADQKQGGMNSAAEQPINFVQALQLEIEIADAYAPSGESVQLRIVTMRRDVAAGLLASLEGLIEALDGLDQAYCRAGPQLTRDERMEDRKRLIAARAALARVKGESA